MISISNLILDDELVTIDHVKALAFNRAASSTGATEAIEYIEKELAKEKIDSKIEYFSWAGPTRVLMRTAYLIILMYLLLSRLILIVVIYFVIKYLFERTRTMTLIKKENSKNIIAEIPANQEGKYRPLVILSAHYDSISANIPYRIQVLTFFLYRIIIGFYVMVIIIFSAWLTLDYLAIFIIPDNVIIIIALLSVVGIIISIPILYLVFNEKPSSGSIDNASGVSILIELAKLFKRNPLEKIDILFIWPGAEEWGMKGSRKFCQRHFLAINQRYDLNRSINVNIDMVGSYIGLVDRVGLFKKRLNKNINDVVEATAKNLNIPLTRYNKFIQPKSDHRSFRSFAKKAAKRLQIVYFHSSKDTKYIHSTRDTPDKCSTKSLNGCLNICYQTLRSIDLRVD
ncbi:MAG: M28 family metallopeptidase [Promethearchaeota archaeon]